MKKTEFHQLGYFIYLFQIIERQIEDLMILITNGDDEMISILISELGFYEKLKTLDVMFARFVDVRTISEEAKKDFHKKIDSVVALSKRRNELVHSKYKSLLNIDGEVGLLRENSKLKPSKGLREKIEEELMPEDFSSDLGEINSSMNDLEAYRLKIIDWLYPSEET
jgi:hypothetical protein